MALVWENQEWPPAGDAQRLANYTRYTQLFEGDHVTAFERSSAYVRPRRRIRYLVANYAGVVSKLAADLLFSEPPTFSAAIPVPPDADQATKEAARAQAEAAQANLDEIVDENDLYTTLYESGLSTSFRGDGVFRVRKGLRHPADDEESCIIEELPASSYFAELSPDHARTVLSEAIAWLHRVPGSKRCYLRVEEHTPGLIRQLAFECSESTGKVGRQVPLSRVYPDELTRPLEEEETGVSRSLLVHVPNLRHGSRFWGLSDYYDLEPLFDAVNNRLSKTEAILDKHASPKLILPPGATGRSSLRASDMDFFEVSTTAESQAAKYLTWDGKLEAAFTHLEHLIDQIFRVAEISPAAFGLDKAGSIESGRAMRMRFLRTAAKIARKKQYFDIAIRWTLWLAQEMRHVHFGKPAPVEPVIYWQDGIPDDAIETTEVEVQRVQGGLSSRKAALMRLYRMTEPQAQEELQRMAGESPAPAPPPAGGNGRVPPGPEPENVPAAAGA